MKTLDRKVEASGGQWQRMAIARSFMRTIADKEGKVKLMCYDEPSSALDPKAEFGARLVFSSFHITLAHTDWYITALFEKLRKERGGRTLIFITQYVDFELYPPNAV